MVITGARHKDEILEEIIKDELADLLEPVGLAAPRCASYIVRFLL